MELELDLDLLSRNLVKAADEPAAPVEDVSPYLLEHVLNRALNGEPVSVADIDFDAFEDDDVEMLEDHYDKLVDAGRDIRQFAVNLIKTTPVASAVRAFC